MLKSPEIRNLSLSKAIIRSMSDENSCQPGASPYEQSNHFRTCPKSSGYELCDLAGKRFGNGQLRLDYADRPIDPNSEMNVDPAGFLSRYGAARRLPEGTLVVHGHFWAKKYERIENAFRITFLRDPIERTISHYYFWLNTPGDGHSLHQRVLDREWECSICSFAAMRGFYRHYFFRDVNIAGFDFIGYMSFFDEELGRLEALLGVRGARIQVGQIPRQTTY